MLWPSNGIGVWLRTGHDALLGAGGPPAAMTISSRSVELKMVVGEAPEPAESPGTGGAPVELCHMWTTGNEGATGRGGQGLTHSWP